MCLKFPTYRQSYLGDRPEESGPQTAAASAVRVEAPMTLGSEPSLLRFGLILGSGRGCCARRIRSRGRLGDGLLFLRCRLRWSVVIHHDFLGWWRRRGRLKSFHLRSQLSQLGFFCGTKIFHTIRERTPASFERAQIVREGLEFILGAKRSGGLSDV